MTVFAAVWALLWYSFCVTWLLELVRYGSGTFVRGEGFVPGYWPPLPSWVMWVGFVLLPLAFLRESVWNALGWEVVSVCSGRIVLERRVFGLSIYRRRVFEGDRVSDICAVPAGTFRRTWWRPRASGPLRRGAVAFRYDGEFVYLAESLLNREEVAERLVPDLLALLNRARPRT